MPDWMTHVLVGLIICEIFNIDKKSLVVLGSTLPDMLLRLFTVSELVLGLPDMYKFLLPMHSLVGGILLSAAVSPLFKFDQKKTFSLISIGVIAHILMDLTTKHITSKVPLILFPFSWRIYELGWFWSGEYYKLLIPAAVAYLIIKIIRGAFSSK